MAITDRDDVAGAPGASVVGSGVLVQEAEDSGAGAAPEPVGTEPKARSQWQLFRRRFLRHKAAVAAALVLVVLGLLAVFASAVAPYPLNPELSAETLLNSSKPPNGAHWFGTDELGRDQLTRVLHAGRISLLIGFSVAIVSTVLGTAIGATAGFFGGRVDQLLMRFTDLFLVVPALAILMIAQQKFGGSVPVMIIILSFLFWQLVARVVRGVFLSLKEKEFVDAAKASGASSLRIIVRHMLPNTVGPIAVNTTLVVGAAILLESTLSFLGFGVQPPTVSWGNMLSQSKNAVGTPTAYLIYFPGLAILLTVLAVNFLGDGLRDAFDPQSNRH